MLFMGYIILMITIMRFMFVIVWRSVRQMNDDLMVAIFSIQAGVFSILLNLSNVIPIRGQYAVSNLIQMFNLVQVNDYIGQITHSAVE